MRSELSFADALASRADILHVDFPEAAVPQLERYFHLLARWNRTVNLTALAVEELAPEAIDRLLLEPLSAARFFPTDRLYWTDLGSGGGSPAIPLKVLRPSAALTMVEARSRKVAFLREATRDLDLSGAVVRLARFEELLSDEALEGSADVVTVRAVKADSIVSNLIEHLLRPAGQLLLFQSSGAPKLECERLALKSIDLLFSFGTAALAVYERMS